MPHASDGVFCKSCGLDTPPAHPEDRYPTVGILLDSFAVYPNVNSTLLRYSKINGDGTTLETLMELFPDSQSYKGGADTCLFRLASLSRFLFIFVEQKHCVCHLLQRAFQRHLDPVMSQ
mmetsp:Transcript_15683/g.22348  ORF Transcript_15683/g.22348 Transcript_15683/m.22348 type:complete len:119 (-) Transcript_15683:26-382(-)